MYWAADAAARIARCVKSTKFGDREMTEGHNGHRIFQCRLLILKRGEQNALRSSRRHTEPEISSSWRFISLQTASVCG
jgi:hypothetical protein